MVTEKVKRTIIEKALVEKGEHIVIGFSGGPDSTCLLHVLYNLASDLELSLYAVHINHCLRDGEADKDQAYTEATCKRMGIPYRVFTYDVKTMASLEGLTTEEMGRQLRYQAFDQVRDEILKKAKKEGKHLSVKIAIAQNQNDQAETVLMRILRGTGTDGLAGMEYIRDGKIIRPLLDISREEIESYCTENALNPRIDLTNLEPMYTRNKIRLELIPLLSEQYNGSILAALNRLAQIASEDKEYLYTEVDKVIDTIIPNKSEVNQRKLIRKEYQKLHPAVGKRIINHSIKEIGLLQDISTVHLEQADKMIRNGKVGDQMDFPKSYGLIIHYETAELYKKDCKEKIKSRKDEGNLFSYRINMDGTTEIPELNAYLRVKILKADQLDCLIRKNPFSACLEYSGQQLFDNIYLRTRRPGDYIVPFGMKGTKKLQDFFVDEKIPQQQREQIPLVCLGSEVLWIIGSRINEKYKIKKETKEAVYLEYICPV